MYTHSHTRTNTLLKCTNSHTDAGPLPSPSYPRARARTTGTRVLFYKASEGLGVERGPFPQTLDCATQGEEVAPSLITVGQRRSGARVLR